MVWLPGASAKPGSSPGIWQQQGPEANQVGGLGAGPPEGPWGGSTEEVGAGLQAWPDPGTLRESSPVSGFSSLLKEAEFRPLTSVQDGVIEAAFGKAGNVTTFHDVFSGSAQSPLQGQQWWLQQPVPAVPRGRAQMCLPHQLLPGQRWAHLCVQLHSEPGEAVPQIPSPVPTP